MSYFEDTRGIRNREFRPRGRLPQESLIDEMLNIVVEYVNVIKTHADVEAISLGGGLSRGYSDIMSEIDLNIYLSASSLIEWEMGNSPVPHGDHMGDKFHMDITFLSIEKEEIEHWGLLKKWDSSYTKVLYDPKGKLEKLLEAKDVFTRDEKREVALINYLACVYFGDIAIRQWIIRKDPLVANQLLSKVIYALCNLLFLVNDEYPPFEKWLVNYTHSLKWKPENWETRLQEVTLINEISLNEVERRKLVFKELYYDIWGKIVGEKSKKIGLLELEVLEAIEYIIDEQPTFDDFKNKFGHKKLGYEVLYKLVEITDINGIQYICINDEKFHEEERKGFPSFLDWNKQILRTVKLTQS